MAGCALAHYRMVEAMGRLGAAGDNAAMDSCFSLLQNNVLNCRAWDNPTRPPDPDRDMDRTDLTAVART